jgi:hypothetical protein
MARLLFWPSPQWVEEAPSEQTRRGVIQQNAYGDVLDLQLLLAFCYVRDIIQESVAFY